MVRFVLWLSAATLGLAAAACGSSGGGSSVDAGEAGTTTDGGAPIDKLGTPCADGGCPSGLQPITYCGFAGCSSGQLCSCEISCSQSPSVCPPGSTCATVSDGPGTVCVKK